MAERIGQTVELMDELARATANRWLHVPERDAERRAYESRGLIYTNNLFQYFVASVNLELWEGYPNPFHYANKSFGQVIASFREEHPDMWQEATTVRAEYATIAHLHGGKQWSEETEMGSPADQPADRDYVMLYWEHAKVFDNVFRIIAPKMIEQGMDPLDACA